MLGASEIAVLTRSPLVRQACGAQRKILVSDDVEQFVSLAFERRPRVLVVDASVDGAVDALRRIEALPSRTVVLVTREPLAELPLGADVVVLEDALSEALAQRLSSERPRAIQLDQLLGVTLLEGSLSEALERVADQLAGGFGVDRCVIVVREDSAKGAAASGTGTWSSLTWNYTTERCRAALQAQAALIAPVPGDPAHACETYLAVPLRTSLGTTAFVGLVAAGARPVGELRGALEAAASRIAAELSWRGSHERVTEELDRLASGPGLDPMLGIWNNIALKQLAGMQVSSAQRNALPVGAAVLDVVDLQGINNRYGLEIGDRLLRRIADVVRMTVREEDVVGRWAGDSIAIVLHGVGIDGMQRIGERLRSALSARPLELLEAPALSIPVTVGVATAESRLSAMELLQNAARAAQRAQDSGVAILHASAQQPTTNPQLSGEFEAFSEPISTTLGGTYRLLHEISRGGMGVVYRAQDRALERPVAIKMLRPDLAEDPELVERFRNEAAMLAHIQHPNLVQVYSFGHTGGDSYFVMELVEGESLEQAFQRYREERITMSLVDMISVVEQIASALDALHERGIVHRDVKPANVIRDPFRNRSVLVDVGIARRYGQHARSAGTPGFIAPEVLVNREATRRSDVYGLAATTYALLTLTRPWGDGDFATQLSRQNANDLVLPSKLRADLQPIDETLMSALHSDPARRPATAGTFARELATKASIILPRRRVDEPPRRIASTPAVAEAKTRGVVFRCVPRAIGVRELEKLRDLISGHDPELARTLTEAAPLAWLPAELMSRLLAIAPQHLSREPETVARDIARATVRASFRRFFPASAATLVPERTLSAIRSIWGRYQSWGTISSMPVHRNEVVVVLTESRRERAMCAWTAGLLEQLVVLSGAKRADIVHETCEADGAEACRFRLTWAYD